MKNLIKISSIGMDKTENTVLKSILKFSPQLNEKFVCIGMELYKTADFVFVNADNQKSLETWHQLKAEIPTIKPIMMTKTKNIIDEEITLHQPMVIKRVVNALEGLLGHELYLPKDAGNQSKKVLVVDDSYSVRKYLEQKLPSLIPDEMHLDFAESGKAAMENIKLIAYDIVFLDVIMPGVDGYKVCKLIKSVRPNTRVVMLTSKKSPFDRVRGSMSGCDDYITKPPADEKLKKILIS